MKTKKINNLYLIDGQGLLYRAFYALPQLSTSSGRIINAAYGFTMVLMKLISEYKPDAIMVAFDTPKPTFRHKKYPQYKAQRQKMPQELIEQIPIVHEILNQFKIKYFLQENYEADDIIGTLCQMAKKNNYVSSVVILKSFLCTKVFQMFIITSIHL